MKTASIRIENEEHGVKCTSYQDFFLLEKPVHVRTKTGYGSKIPTPYITKFRSRTHRIYATCYGNSASLWIKSRGKKYYLL